MVEFQILLPYNSSAAGSVQKESVELQYMILRKSNKGLNEKKS